MSASQKPDRFDWGYLIKPDKSASPKLEQLCLGIANLISKFQPTATKELTPDKLARFYRAVGGNYDPLFLETPHSSLSFIYQSLGCFHALLPTANAFEKPCVPALLFHGFVRWQTIQLLLCPQEHAPFLREAVKRFDIIDPSNGSRFPKEIPNSAFPSKPDPEMLKWHETVSKRLEREYESAKPAQTSDNKTFQSQPQSQAQAQAQPQPQPQPQLQPQRQQPQRQQQRQEPDTVLPSDSISLIDTTDTDEEEDEEEAQRENYDYFSQSHKHPFPSSTRISRHHASRSPSPVRCRSSMHTQRRSDDMPPLRSRPRTRYGENRPKSGVYEFLRPKSPPPPVRTRGRSCTPRGIRSPYSDWTSESEGTEELVEIRMDDAPLPGRSREQDRERGREREHSNPQSRRNTLYGRYTPPYTQPRARRHSHDAMYPPPELDGVAPRRRRGDESISDSPARHRQPVHPIPYSNNIPDPTPNPKPAREIYYTYAPTSKGQPSTNTIPNKQRSQNQSQSYYYTANDDSIIRPHRTSSTRKSRPATPKLRPDPQPPVTSSTPTPSIHPRRQSVSQAQAQAQHAQAEARRRSKSAQSHSRSNDRIFLQPSSSATTGTPSAGPMQIPIPIPAPSPPLQSTSSAQPTAASARRPGKPKRGPTFNNANGGVYSRTNGNSTNIPSGIGVDPSPITVTSIPGKRPYPATRWDTAIHHGVGRQRS